MNDHDAHRLPQEDIMIVEDNASDLKFEMHRPKRNTRQEKKPVQISLV